ncbi:MAG TPA: hypothetical protein VGK60_03550 [Pedococcus sp.]
MPAAHSSPEHGPEPHSTIANLQDGLSTRAAWGRRAVLLLVLLVVVAALVGLLGVRTATRTASGGGYQLRVDYPAIARPGMDVRWHVEVDHPGGFGKGVELAVSGKYFDIFESQGMWPQADTMTRDGRYVYLTFAPPRGDTFMLDFDTYVQPASAAGSSARLAVVDAAREQVGVDFSTRLVP